MRTVLKPKTLISVLLLFVATLSSPLLTAQAIAVRNDVPRVGQQEVLMLRHAFLEKGQYQTWYQASREGVWPWFEKIGARIVGDWQVLYPEGGSGNPDLDEAYRLARYASYEHWQATRGSGSTASGSTGGSSLLGGNGPDLALSNASIQQRRTVSRGSKGGIFLQGYMAENRPIYIPGSGETFQQVQQSQQTATVEGSELAVRHDVARPNQDFMSLVYWKIRKGSFEEFHALTRDNIYPYLEKIGVRPVGQWQVVYLPGATPEESPDYDEVYLIARYASYEHWQATQTPEQLGGDGPDFQAFREALRRREPLTLDYSIQFMQGPLYGSPPLYMPALDETYRKID